MIETMDPPSAARACKKPQWYTIGDGNVVRRCQDATAIFGKQLASSSLNGKLVQLYCRSVSINEIHLAISSEIL